MGKISYLLMSQFITFLIIWALAAIFSLGWVDQMTARIINGSIHSSCATLDIRKVITSASSGWTFATNYWLRLLVLQKLTDVSVLIWRKSVSLLKLKFWSRFTRASPAQISAVELCSQAYLLSTSIALCLPSSCIDGLKIDSPSSRLACRLRSLLLNIGDLVRSTLSEDI